jgi:hypothetical protein
MFYFRGANVRYGLFFGVLCAGPNTAIARAEAPGIVERPITAADRAHWAFQPLRRTTPPVVDPLPTSDNPIDHFINAKLAAIGLEALPTARRVTLIRRVTFDLTGLPPTLPEIDAFVTDPKPGAYERLIDRLLDSPSYGIRWAQHWLDLARFAESNGYENDEPRPLAWKYRDWVIDAFNRDLPFDEFVRQQIAGDELYPGDLLAAIATGFALCGQDIPDQNLQEQRRTMLLNEITSTIGSVFLGLKLECAECHDHKYDPISQADFYRMRAFFENVDVFAESRLGRVLCQSEAAPKSTYLLVRGDFHRPGPEVQPAFLRIVNLQNQQVAPPQPGMKTTGRRSALARWLTHPKHPLTTRVIVNWLWQHHFGMGLVRSPGVFGVMGQPPTHPELLDWLATELPRQGWSLKAMHKQMLMSLAYRRASSVTSSVTTGEDLPVEMAVLEDRYNQAKKADPQNHWLARMNRVRLDGEAIRDAVLAASGRLCPRRGGPGIMAPLPEEMLSLLEPRHWTVSSDPEDHRRRSIFLFVRRNVRLPLFDAFDRPDTLSSCPRRHRSTTAPQALVLLNSDLCLASARHLAGQSLEAAGRDQAAQIEFCYRRTLGRTPTTVELEQASRFLDAQAELLAAGGRAPTDLALPVPCSDGEDPYAAASLTDLCLALLNLNEFIYLD